MIKQQMASTNHGIGQEMIELVRELFPICRSITGDGVRQTLSILQKHVPLTVHEVPSGTQVFDWTVPREWNIRDAYFLDEDGNKYCDFKENNLHVMSYSVPVDQMVSLEELDGHLYSLPDHPDAIPYTTSFYQKRWGFGIALNRRKQLKAGQYRVFIDSDLKDGHLTYADGSSDLIEISDLIGVPVWELYPIVEQLKEVDLLEENPVEFAG